MCFNVDFIDADEFLGSFVDLFCNFCGCNSIDKFDRYMNVTLFDSCS